MIGSYTEIQLFRPLVKLYSVIMTSISGWTILWGRMCQMKRMRMLTMMMEGWMKEYRWKRSLWWPSSWVFGFTHYTGKHHKITHFLNFGRFWVMSMSVRAVNIFEKFQAILSTFFPFFLNFKIDTPGGREGPPNLVSPQTLFLLWLKTTRKIFKPYDNPFWEKSNPGGEKK